MANQWIEIFEHTARDTVAGTETSYPLPVKGNLKPSFEALDEGRKEFYGSDTGQGNATVNRKDSFWNMTIEANAYPVRGMGILLKHALGTALARTVIDTSGYTGLIRAINMPFGSVGNHLEDKAIGLHVYYDDGEGVTKLRTYYGGRVNGALEIKGEGSDEITFSVPLKGPGECVSAISEPGDTPPNPATLPAPFNFKDCSFYLGSGITRTGSAPDFTDLDPNTMQTFQPDSMSISLGFGREDKRKGGDLVTEKTGQMAITASFPVDIRDPSSGFSSRDELDEIIDAVRTSSVLVVMDNGELAGAATENFQIFIDIPKLFWKAGEEEFNTEGTQPKTTLEGEHLYDSAVGYSAALMIIDDVAAYE